MLQVRLDGPLKLASMYVTREIAGLLWRVTKTNALCCTGGTETGHASGTYSHWNGYKLDTSLNTCLNNYIQNTYTRIEDRPGDGAPQYEAASGNIYAQESNHWDILYMATAC